MPYIDTLRQLKTCNLNGFRRFIVAGQKVGWINPKLAKALAEKTTIFKVTESEVILSESLKTMEERTAAGQATIDQLVASGDLPPTPYVVPQYYPVSADFNGHVEAPVMLMRRLYCTKFGVKRHGVQVIGYTDAGMWLSRRSLNVATYAGKLDTLVGSGQPWGVSFFENAVQEGIEEAQLSETVLRSMKPAGLVSMFTSFDGDYVTHESIRVFDLKLHESLIPHADGYEVDRHTLTPWSEVIKLMAEPGHFKTTAYPVIVDFLMRHGHIPAAHPNYEEMAVLLRQAPNPDTGRIL